MPGSRFALTSILCAALSCSALACAANNQPLRRIALGSCALQGAPQPIWNAVLAAEPDVMLMLGDNVYGDTLDMDVLRNKYAQLGADAGFAKLRRMVPVLATWDDHDYGVNDAGAEHPMKAESQKVFLDFFEEPRDSARRSREGVYGAHVFGPKGKRVQVILLDTRYFRSPLRAKPQRVKGEGPYEPNRDPNATMLGETQWAWLAQQLRKPAELRIIASSVQVVSTEHGWETWGNLPHERKRLFDLIRETGATGVIFVSGDRHHGELSCERGNGAAYPFYDLTSSGLNRGRSPDAKLEGNSRRLAPLCLENNFGSISVNWAAEDPLIDLEILNVDGAAKISRQIPLSELR